MTLSEKRNEIYNLISVEIKNKEITPKEWQKFQKTLSGLLKSYSDTPKEPQIIYKEKPIKIQFKKGYWDM